MNNIYLFNEKKAAQSAAYFLFRAGGTLSVLKLMKLMYLAERCSFQQFGIPLIGDSLVSMPHGPVLSMTYEHISDMNDDSTWKEWISERVGNNLSLRDSSLIRTTDDLLALSDSDLAVLDSVWQNFGNWTASRLRNYTHDECPEWEDPLGSSRPISYDKLLTVLGFEFESRHIIIEQIGRASCRERV